MAVDPATLGQNLWLIVAAIVLLGMVATAGVAVSAVVRSALAMRRQTRSLAAYAAALRRPNGEAYPPFFAGRCQRCSRGHSRIYAAESGKELCPTCLDAED